MVENESFCRAGVVNDFLMARKPAEREKSGARMGSERLSSVRKFVQFADTKKPAQWRACHVSVTN